MNLARDVRKAIGTGALITAASIFMSVMPVYIWLQIDPVIDHASIYLSCIVLPAIIAPSCSVLILRAQLRAERLAKDNHRLANEDALTGLPNRRAFMAAAHDLQARAAAGQGLLVCAIADIDNFKRLNDSFGHDAGDAVLRRTGELLRAVVPPRAMAARLGGEEFAIAGLFAHEGEARAVFAGVVRAVARAACEFEGQRLQVTISLGFAAAAPEETVSALLSRADKALYHAKRTGKNRVAGAAEAMLEAWLKVPESGAA